MSSFGEIVMVVTLKHVAFVVLLGACCFVSLQWALSPFRCQASSGQEDIVIKQIFLGHYLRKAFARTILQNTPLKMYTDPTQPAFFYGLSTVESLDVLKRHQSFAVVIYTGGDGNHFWASGQRVFRFVRDKWYVSSVAISSFIAHSLARERIPYLRVPFYPLPLDNILPVKKGRSVYCYGNVDSVYHNDVVIHNISKALPEFEFIFAAHAATLNEQLRPPWKHYTSQQLWRKVYPRCFVGIRLTSHDGLGATVQELGAMGIRTIWNGGTPSAIPWRTNEDVIRAIRTEAASIGTVDHELSDRVKQFLRIDPSFYKLKTHFSVPFVQ